MPRPWQGSPRARQRWAQPDWLALSMMIKGNLQAAMMGLGVVPIFAGYDLRREVGRLWAFDITGGRYEEREYVATGSGSLHAGTVIKLGYREGIDRDTAVDLACRALWEAADADSATGGPDALRGIYPIIATITADGFCASATTSWPSATAATASARERFDHEHAVHAFPGHAGRGAPSLALGRSHEARP